MSDPRLAATAAGMPRPIAFTALTAFGLVSRIAAAEGDPLNLTWWNVVLYALSAGACVFVGSGARRRVHSRS